MAAPWWLPFGAVPEISGLAFFEALRSGARWQILDVRTTLEFRNGHLEGAVSVPVTELATRLPTLKLDPSRPVLAICLSAHRSIPAVRLLRREGFDAQQLQGGMLAWWAAGLPQVRD